jgi:hypothetical protein
MLKEPIHLFYQALYVLLYPVTVCAVLAIIVGFAEVVRFRSLTNFARTTWTLYLIGLPVGLVGYLIWFYGRGQ